MALIHYESLQNLQPFTQIQWRIKVKVSRKWDDYSGNNGVDRGVHMIVVDEYVKYLKFLLDFFI